MDSPGSALGLVPTSARDVWQTLGNMGREENEERLAFAVAGALFLAGVKAGFYSGSSRAGVDRTILFFKFLESVDPRMRFDKTFTNLCGRFVNYVDSKLLKDDGTPNWSAREPIRVLMEGLGGVSAGDDETKARVVQALLRVRDAMYLFVAFSYDWAQKMKDIDGIPRPQLGGNGGQV
jgi:hypothetical protein